MFAIYGYSTYGASSTSTYDFDVTAILGKYRGTYVYVNISNGVNFKPSQPLVRQAVEGSGFAVALRVNDGGSTAPYSLKGFQLEYQTGAREINGDRLLIYKTVFV